MSTGRIMGSGDYQVVFQGEITGDYPEETVKQQLADLFGMPTQRIDALFAGKPVVVKKNVDRSTAERFEQTFRKAGARCEIRGPDGEAASPSTGGDAPAAASGSGAQGDPAAASAEGSAAGSTRTRRTDPGTGATAAAGDPNQTVVALDVPESFEGLEVDDSDTPLAPPERPEAPAIDTSELSLAGDDAGPLGSRERPPPAEIDTSGLSMESLDDEGGGSTSAP